MEKRLEAWNETQKYEGVINALELKGEKQQWLEDHIRKLKDGLQERHESDDWLRSEVEQYEGRLAVHEQHREKKTTEYNNLQRVIEQGREKVRRKDVEAGRYQEQKNNHEQQIERRKNVTKETARRHQIRGYETEIDDSKINDFVERITKMSKDQNAAVEKARKEIEGDRKKIQDALKNLGERRSALNEGKNSAKSQIASNDRKISSIQSELSKFEIDEGAKAIFEDKIGDIKASLSRAREEAKAGSWDKKIQEGNVQVRTGEGESEQLNKEMIQGTEHAYELGRVKQIKIDIADRQRNLEKMKDVHNEKLRDLLGHEWQPSRVELDFRKAMDRKEGEVKNAERQREKHDRELEQVNFKLDSSRKELRNGQTECDEYVKLLGGIVVNPEDYPTELATCQYNRDTAKADAGNSQYLTEFFENAVKMADTKHKCRLCTRSFASDETEAFIDSMKTKIKKHEGKDYERVLEKAEKELRTAKDVGPSYDSWVRLSRNDLPKLEGEIKSLTSDRDQILQDLEHHDGILADRKGSTTDVESLSKTISSIGKYWQEMSSFSTTLKELETKQRLAGTTRSTDVIQDELEAINGKMRNLRKTIEKLTSDRERSRSHISALELELSEAKSQLGNATHQLDKKANSTKQAQDLKVANQAQREILRQSDEQLRDIEPQIADEESRLEDVKQHGDSRERDLHQKASQLSDSVNRLQNAGEAIRAYMDDGGPAKLAKCHRDIEVLQQEIQQSVDEQKDIASTINKIGKELSNHTETKRIIINNIDYRNDLRALETIKAEIANLSAQNAVADQARWAKTATKWDNKHTLLTTERASVNATAAEKDKTLQKNVADWNTDYKNAKMEFKKAHIEVEVGLLYRIEK